MGRHHTRTGALSEEHGQAVIFVVVFLVAVIGIIGFVVDIGHAYQAQRSLQGAADAAALAGAQALPDANAAQTTAKQYGSSATGKNQITDVNVKETVTTSCNTTIPGCSPVNMVSVDEAATVSTYFSKIVGVDSFNVKVHAAACSPCGAKPVDIMIVLDRTGSMCTNAQNQNDGCVDLNNAKAGIRTFLGFFDSSMAHVGLAVLPPATSVGNRCSTPASGNYNSTSAAYTVVPLSNDFRNANGTLNASSNLISTLACVQGAGTTSYANAIEAGQTELEAHGRTNVPKMIVFFTDGAANTGPTYYPTSSLYRMTPCHQGINSAAGVKAKGTVIYSIGYALDDDTGGCRAYTGAAEKPTPPTITVRETLSQIASAPDKFLQRPTSGELQTIFSAVAQDISQGTSSLIN
jgi:Flp pilus assembly protein TadG